jgi:glycosyltransferase involved in cell wall biosynthesis
VTRDDAPRVLIASRLFVPEVSAGAFRLGALARGLSGAGARVTVVTTTPPAHAPATPDPEDVVVRRAPVLRDGGGNVRGYIQYASFDAPLAFRILFRGWDAAVAESPPTTALVVRAAAWLRRRPYAYYAADVWTDGVIAMGAARPVIGLMRAMERASLRGAAVVLSVSDEVTARLIALGAPPERIATIGNGIDTDVFRPDGPVAAAGERYFVYTGTMSEWQRPDVFIRAFATIAEEHPDLRLRFFGQGAVEADLRALADRLVPGRVVFGGVVDPQTSAAWLRGAIGALVSIAPGIGYDFARPTKTYAAAACGTPVLFAGAEVGGGLVRDADLGEAVAFAPDAVADAMRRLIVLADTGQSARSRERRAAWARDTVSLTAAGRRAADAVLAVLPGPDRSGR